MSADETRIELLVDVFGLVGQRALALAALTPPQLVAAVLEEFGELEYLGNTAGDYQLLKAADSSPLDDAAPIGQQLAAGERLVLAERAPPPPAGTRVPSQAAYLREQGSGKVYKLHWQPAIIGRPDRADNERLLVDLTGHQAGQRVSRRHAQVVESNGQFFVEPLSSNPTAVQDLAGGTVRAEKRHPLRHGDVILLENSQIALKFIVRE